MKHEDYERIAKEKYEANMKKYKKQINNHYILKPPGNKPSQYYEEGNRELLAHNYAKMHAYNNNNNTITKLEKKIQNNINTLK